MGWLGGGGGLDGGLTELVRLGREEAVGIPDGEKICLFEEVMVVFGVGVRAPFHQQEDGEEKRDWSEIRTCLMLANIQSTMDSSDYELAKVGCEPICRLLFIMTA